MYLISHRLSFDNDRTVRTPIRTFTETNQSVTHVIATGSDMCVKASMFIKRVDSGVGLLPHSSSVRSFRLRYHKHANFTHAASGLVCTFGSLLPKETAVISTLNLPIQGVSPIEQTSSPFVQDYSIYRVQIIGRLTTKSTLKIWNNLSKPTNLRATHFANRS